MDNTFKTKNGDKEVELKTIPVNSDIRNKSNEWYNKAFNDALDKGYLLRLEAEAVLAGRNLLDDDEDEKTILTLRKEIKDKEIELRSGKHQGKKMTPQMGYEWAISIKKLRQKLDAVGTNKTSFYKNTVESYAEDERFQYFIFACTVLASNNQTYWLNFEVFKNSMQDQAYADAVQSFIVVNLGFTNEREAELYENKWLKRMGFMNDKFQLINKKGHLVDEQGRLIDEKGRYVNDSGQYVDIYGNLVDEAGNLLVEDGWAEEQSNKEPVPPVAIQST